MSKKEGVKRNVPESIIKTLEFRPYDWFVKYENNPREHSATQIKEIESSILEYGFINPILAKSDGTIVEGEAALVAAGNVGYAELPVIIIDHLTENQVKKLRIALNKTHDNSGFNEKKLYDEIAALLDAGEDITNMGFDQLEIDDLMDGYYDEDEDDEELPPPTPSKSAPVISGPGDIWVMGRHRLLCGSSNKAENIENLIQGDSPDLVIISTPREEVNNVDYKGLQKTYKDAALFLFLANHFKGLPAGNEFIVWDKGRKGSDFSDVSLAWSNIPGGICSKINGALEVDEDAPDIADQKPPEFYEKLYKRFPKKPPVLELFAGLGGGLIAAENGKKAYRGIELEPSAVDYAVMKWQTHTGQKAILENTGETFGSIYGKRVNG